MDITTLGTVVGIVAICYVIGLGCKAYEKIPDKWIPVIMAVCGGALGIAGLYTMPDFTYYIVCDIAQEGEEYEHYRNKP